VYPLQSRAKMSTMLKQRADLGRLSMKVAQRSPEAGVPLTVIANSVSQRRSQSHSLTA
jgi:hypothetical protein